MHTCHGLFWEHWNQSRLWIVGAASFLVLMTFGVWLNHDWVMREFRNDPFELDKFAWVVGFTAVCLMFVNYRVREVNLYFPRRQFALPCRTVPLGAESRRHGSPTAEELPVAEVTCRRRKSCR